MNILNGEQMRNLDRIAIEEYGIPGIILMENAGICVMEEIIKILNESNNKEVLIICGKGNNGGDGFVVARHLHRMKIPTKVCIIGEPSLIKGDSKINLEIIKRLHMDIFLIKGDHDLQKLHRSLDECTLVVDGLFGTGLHREIEGIAKKVIDFMNQSKKIILSIDIPSGISADNGRVMGIAVKAHKTVAFQLPKIGNINHPGADYGGDLIIKDIGIPDVAIMEMKTSLSLITKEDVEKILPPRQNDTHKGTYGKAYLIAGSIGMTGAAILTSEAVLRSGAGLLKVAIPQSLNGIMETRLTEAITIPLPELKKGVVGLSDIEKIITTMKEMDVIALGPGSGQNRELEEVVRNIIERTVTPMVIDADGLNALAHRPELLMQFRSSVVITPHVGEMARLTNLEKSYIHDNRIEVAKEYASKWKVIIVLKGAVTVVAGPEGQTFINITGNPGMATPGSGDVLTGIITGFIAQGIEPLKAAIAAVYIHGAAGDRAAAKMGQYGMIAGDIVKELPLSIKELVGQ